MTADPSGEPPPDGHLRPLSAAPLSLAAVLGLVGGWLLHPVSVRLEGSAPLVSWLQGLVLFFVTVVMGFTAWATWRSVHVRRELLEPHRAVNRLVLARACALVGALVAGGYAGYAVSWLGQGSEIAGSRVATSLFAAAGGLTVMIASLLLERACRTRRADPEP